jgi:hypothetical protein
MREGATSQVLAGAPGWAPSVSSWLGGDVLAEDVPLVDGSLQVDVTQQIPERVTITVPEQVDGFSWVPGDDPYHPLAKFGQYLDISVTVTSPVSGTDAETRLGRFQIQDWTHDDLAGVVQVECVGLLQRPDDDRFLTPQVPRSGETFASLLARLVGGGMPVVFDAALVDRAVPTSFQWGEDRLGALYEIADAWPARLRVDEYGQLQVLAPLPDVPAPVLSFTDGLGGTVVSAPTSGTRDNVYNVVVARSSVTDDPAHAPVQGVAMVTSGPFSALGPYGRVVRFWSSPLATTTAQLTKAAQSLLASSLRPARQRVVTCAPDPRIELDDPVEVVTGVSVKRGTRRIVASGRLDPVEVADTSNAVRQVGYVVGYDLPLTAGGGSMTVRVGVS